MEPIDSSGKLKEIQEGLYFISPVTERDVDELQKRIEVVSKQIKELGKEFQPTTSAQKKIMERFKDTQKSLMLVSEETTAEIRTLGHNVKKENELIDKTTKKINGLVNYKPSFFTFFPKTPEKRFVEAQQISPKLRSHLSKGDSSTITQKLNRKIAGIEVLMGRLRQATKERVALSDQTHRLIHVVAEQHKQYKKYVNNYRNESQLKSNLNTLNDQLQQLKELENNLNNTKINIKSKDQSEEERFIKEQQNAYNILLKLVTESFETIETRMADETQLKPTPAIFKFFGFNFNPSLPIERLGYKKSEEYSSIIHLGMESQPKSEPGDYRKKIVTTAASPAPLTTSLLSQKAVPTLASSSPTITSTTKDTPLNAQEIDRLRELETLMKGPPPLMSDVEKRKIWDKNKIELEAFRKRPQPPLTPPSA